MSTDVELEKEYYSVTEIAELAKVCRQRIHQIIQCGKLMPDITTKFEYIFKKETVSKFLKQFKRRAW